MKTNCIVCEAEVDNWDIAYPDKKAVHPIGGTAFRTYGHYGSAIFDPMDASYLEIVVCDECLKGKLKHTYDGINEEYAKELEDFRAKQESLIESLLKRTKTDV